MEKMQQILDSLGIDKSLLFQLGIFLVVYFILSRALFKPYFAAFKERQARTEGSEEHADRLITEAADLETVYQKKARGFNSDTKEIFDKSRSEALHQHDEMVSKARARAHGILEESRNHIDDQVKAARKALADEAPGVSKDIVNRLAGKELIQ